MRDGFKKIASFPDALLGHAAKSKLEDEGIECLIANEHTIGMDFFYSQALGGVQLWVPEKDVSRADRALSEIQPLEEVEDEPEEPSSDDAALSCPKCGSKNVSNLRKPSGLTMAFFFFGLPLPFFRRKPRCYQCGNTEFR